MHVRACTHIHIMVRELGSSGAKAFSCTRDDSWPLWNLKWWLLPLSLSATRIGLWFIAGRLFVWMPRSSCQHPCKQWVLASHNLRGVLLESLVLVWLRGPLLPSISHMTCLHLIPSCVLLLRIEGEGQRYNGNNKNGGYSFQFILVGNGLAVAKLGRLADHASPEHKPETHRAEEVLFQMHFPFLSNQQFICFPKAGINS